MHFKPPERHLTARHIQFKLERGGAGADSLVFRGRRSGEPHLPPPPGFSVARFPTTVFPTTASLSWNEFRPSPVLRAAAVFDSVVSRALGTRPVPFPNSLEPNRHSEAAFTEIASDGSAEW